MTHSRILVAGVGNIFLGDDAFGVEVVWRLAKRSLPIEVRVIDFGIRSFDLACAILDGYDAAILVDATQRGGKPGSLYVLEPDLDDLDNQEDQKTTVDAHRMDLQSVFRLVRQMGGRFPCMLLVGCEPATTALDEYGAIGLSEAVQESIDRAGAIVESLVSDLLKANRDKVG